MCGTLRLTASEARKRGLGTAQRFFNGLSIKGIGTAGALLNVEGNIYLSRYARSEKVRFEKNSAQWMGLRGSIKALPIIGFTERWRPYKVKGAAQFICLTDAGGREERCVLLTRPTGKYLWGREVRIPVIVSNT